MDVIRLMPADRAFLLIPEPQPNALVMEPMKAFKERRVPTSLREVLSADDAVHTRGPVILALLVLRYLAFFVLLLLRVSQVLTMLVGVGVPLLSLVALMSEIRHEIAHKILHEIRAHIAPSHVLLHWVVRRVTLAVDGDTEVLEIHILAHKLPEIEALAVILASGAAAIIPLVLLLLVALVISLVPGAVPAGVAPPWWHNDPAVHRIIHYPAIAPLDLDHNAIVRPVYHYLAIILPDLDVVVHPVQCQIMAAFIDFYVVVHPVDGQIRTSPSKLDTLVHVVNRRHWILEPLFFIFLMGNFK